MRKVTPALCPAAPQALPPVAGVKHPPCAACRWTDAGQCGLTRAPLPAGGQGCCHHDIHPQSGPQRVSRDSLQLLGIRFDEPEEFVLAREDVPYARDAAGNLWVDIDALNLPFIYGQGTDHLPDEAIDWSAWFERWGCLEEQ